VFLTAPSLWLLLELGDDNPAASLRSGEIYSSVVVVKRCYKGRVGRSVNDPAASLHSDKIYSSVVVVKRCCIEGKGGERSVNDPASSLHPAEIYSSVV
jgi:hypothetical protein